MCEELSQPTKDANKIIISIFLTRKATILDTHMVSNMELRSFLCDIKISVPVIPIMSYKRFNT